MVEKARQRVANALNEGAINEKDAAAINKHIGEGKDLLHAMNVLNGVVQQTRTASQIFGDDGTKGKRYSTGESAAQNLHPDVVESLYANDLSGALKHISENSDNSITKAVAARLHPLLGKTRVSIDNALKTPTGQSAKGAATTDGTHIYLHSTEGMDEETLLHESVHAASESILTADPKTWTAEQRSAIGELNQVWNAAKVDPKINLSDKAKTSLSEFVTEAMTKAPLQADLAAKSWKSKTAWEGFKTAILRMLGISDITNMRDATIASMDTIFAAPDMADNSKRAFRVNSTTIQLAEGAGAVTPLQKHWTSQIITGFKTSAGVNWGTKVRTQGADIAATVESRLNKQFDSSVRDSLNKINPMGVYRQAQDYGQMLYNFVRRGALKRNLTTGNWEATNAVGFKPPADIYPVVHAWGAKQGFSPEKSEQYASHILEAVRLDGLREAAKRENLPFVPHAIDKTSKMSAAQQIDHLVKEYKADPALQAMSKLMDEPRIALVDHMIDVGRLSPEEGKAWKEVVGYVPFDRLVETSEKFAKVKKTTSNGRLAVSKLPVLIGSLKHPVGNVFDNYINTLGWQVGQIINSDARLRVLRNLEDIGYAKFIGSAETVRLRSDVNSANTTYAFVAGEQVYWELPSKYDVMAFKDLNAVKPAYLRILGKFTNTLRATVTIMPSFGIKQVTDDLQRAILTSGVKNPLALTRMVLSSYPKLAYEALKHNGHPLMGGLHDVGITGGFDTAEGTTAESLKKSLGYAPRGMFGSMVHRLESISRASDFTVRKAIHDQTLVETKSSIYPAGDVLLAQTRAREFINFRRRGNSEFVGVMATTIPFANAYIQAMDVLLRAMSGSGASSSIATAQAKALFVKHALVTTAMSTLYAMGKSDDDEEYNDADLRTRDNNWLLGNGIKLSAPGELAVMFKVIPERVIEYYKRYGTPEEQTAMEAIRTTLSYASEQYVTRITTLPQVIKPIAEAIANYSILSGRPLEGIHQQAMDRSQRVGEQTSELAKLVAKFSSEQLSIEVSPIKIDSVLRGYFGSVAAMTLMVSDNLVNPNRVDRPINKWAFLSNYMLDEVGTRRQGEFYNLREKAGQAHATFQELVKTDINAAIAYQEKHQQELAMYPFVTNTLQQLAKTRATRTFLSSKNGAEAMPDSAERLQFLQEVRKQEIALTQWVREVEAMYNKTQ
jgi:hypothetical protein